MSTHGIALRNKSGRVFFTTESITWNYLDSFIVPPGQTIYRPCQALSFVSEVIFQRTFVNSAPDNQEAYICDAYRSGNYVVATGGAVPTMLVVLGR